MKRCLANPEHLGLKCKKGNDGRPGEQGQAGTRNRSKQAATTE